LPPTWMKSEATPSSGTLGRVFDLGRTAMAGASDGRRYPSSSRGRPLLLLRHTSLLLARSGSAQMLATLDGSFFIWDRLVVPPAR
jgi:hypothetical protein